MIVVRVRRRIRALRDTIGLVALLLATLDHRRHMNALRASYGPMPISLAAVVAFLIAVLGLFGMASVVLAR